VLIVAVVWVAYSFKAAPPPVKIFELVAGEGDNYMATEAPALGSPSAVKLDLPAPQPAPPAKVETTPIQAAPPVQQAPKEIVPTKAPPPPKKEPSFAKQIQRRLDRAEKKAKEEVRKQIAEEQKRMTKAQFDAANKAKAANESKASKPPPKIAKIDTKGIAKGVVGGSVLSILAAIYLYRFERFSRGVFIINMNFIG